ncbi:MAG: hypothetical protein HZB15_11870 [Actinobacteria bacterium]|nr:hypothetical protein [Actinomycetota bacterium]
MIASRRRVLCLIVAGALVTACGSDDDETGGELTPSTEAGTATSAPLAVAERGSAATVVDDAEPSTTPAPATTPPTVPPTTPAPPPPTVVPPVPRVLLVGDSTLLAVQEYDTLGVLLGMDPVYEAESCRALAQPSCSDDPPANSVTVIDGAEGAFDVVVIMAGYDEWYTTFADSFDRVVASSRAKGAKRIVWLTYPENVDYRLPDDQPANESLVNMNQIMRDLVAGGAYPDVVIADWFHYSSGTQGWYSEDDIHLSQTGAHAVADYIARKVAFIAGAPCPMPREPGQPVETPCPDPDVAGPVADVVALYAA